METVRLMRHEGIRVVISTQSPKVLAPELLELATMTVIHRFHSDDWFQHLLAKIPLPRSLFRKITLLEPGESFMFCSKYLDDKSNLPRPAVLRIKVRPRVTVDHGVSRINKLAN